MAVALVGPPGLGKSRLVDELLRGEPGALVGRAVPGVAGGYRPVVEALAGVDRAARPSGPHRAVVDRLLTGVQAPDASADRPWVVAEAMVRSVGRRIVVLEDLHWSDPDTLAVVEYLADNVAATRCLLLLTARDEPGPALDVIDRLARRGAVVVIRLDALDEPAVVEMAAGCLGHPPSEEIRRSLARAEGSPLLVEELVASGPGVPETLVELTTARVAGLSTEARRCVFAVAVLGEGCDDVVVAGTVGLGADAVGDALREAVAGGVLDLVGGIGFRHALHREAVLASLLPSERTAWSSRALTALEEADPGLAGRDGLAADLAEAAGDRRRAAALLIRAGRADTDRGALATAEDTLRRATDLAGGDATTAVLAHEALADVLALAGRPVDTATTTDRLLALLQQTAASPQRMARAQLRPARAWTAAADWSAARAVVDAARELMATDPGEPADRAASAEVDVAEAQIAIATGRIALAAARARQAITTTEHAGPFPVLCEALEVLGRVTRLRDTRAAEELFGRAYAVAEAHDLPVWQMRALHELSTIDTLTSLRLDRLDAARALAERIGAVATTNVVSLHRAGVLFMRGRCEEAIVEAEACAAVAERVGLATLPVALIFAADARVALGQRAAAAGLEARAVAWRPDPLVEVAACGNRALRALVIEDRDRALGHLRRGLDLIRAHPTVTSPPTLGFAAAVLALVGEDPFEDLDTAALTRWNAGLVGFARAIALGRGGHPDDATAAFAEADTVLAGPPEIPFHRRLGRRLAAEAAVADGWGNPAGWLRDDAVWFATAGHDRIAAACRGLLARGGGRPGRHTPGPPIPDTLRTAGVTGREMEVLLLVADGLSNATIGERLYLSPRTVEKHVERLLAKTGTATRLELVARAARREW
ncbi:AAA family ATPase [Actinomycetospora chlora]|uniref:AAA family ATPase n=1 Tax=Actinomycetospora chlora TaxID=663608 RepID=A0ABP9A7Q9_9PSEU